MAITQTIEAVRDAINSGDSAQNREARDLLTDPAVRRTLLDARMDTTGMSDEDVETNLIEESRL